MTTPKYDESYEDVNHKKMSVSKEAQKIAKELAEQFGGDERDPEAYAKSYEDFEEKTITSERAKD